jgi:hypothetical protein
VARSGARQRPGQRKELNCHIRLARAS